MALPSDSDYQTALQNPRRAFADAELREGQPELGTGAMAGLPRPRAGNFATAYKLHCGERTWAVRCFTRRIQPDQQERYEKIAGHLALHRLPYAVDFTFLPEGIQVHGEWHPIVKMEWVQGESLGRYIEKNRANPQALFDLAAQWVEMLATLQHVGIAHGDLQHGNVIVTPGGLRLIDYDGMFVPALEGRVSHERGHDNYQHPRRDAGFFDGRLDHFSAWVVLVSLGAVAHEPDLWDTFQGGDDCLLFRKRDFVDPQGSKLFQTLLGSRNERVRFLASFFHSLLFLHPTQVPAPGGQPRTEAGASKTSSGALSPWVQEFLVSSLAASASFTPPTLRERQAAGGMLLAALTTLTLTFTASPFWGAGLGLLGLSGLGWVRSMYGRQEATRERTRAQARLEEERGALERAETLLQTLTQERDALEQGIQTRRAKLDDLETRMRAAAERVHEKYQADLQWLAYHQKHLDHQEETARKALDAEIREKEEDFARRVAPLPAAEQAAYEGALRKLQDSHVEAALRSATLDAVTLPRVNAHARAALQAAGLHTAADVGHGLHLLKGIHRKRIEALRQWATEREAQARATQPTSLPEDARAAIQEQYRQERAELDARRAEEQQRLASQSEALTAHFARMRQDPRVQEEQLRKSVLREEADARAPFSAEVQQLALELEQYEQRLKEMEERLAVAGRDLFKLRWNRDEVESRLAAYAPLDFRRYLAYLLNQDHEPA